MFSVTKPSIYESGCLGSVLGCSASIRGVRRAEGFCRVVLGEQGVCSARLGEHKCKSTHLVIVRLSCSASKNVFGEHNRLLGELRCQQKSCSPSNKLSNAYKNVSIGHL